MKSIKVDYTDPDNRVITVVDDDDEERELEIDDGVQTVTIDGDALEITKTTNSKVTVGGTTGVFVASLLLFILGFSGASGVMIAIWVWNTIFPN